MARYKKHQIEDSIPNHKFDKKVIDAWMDECVKLINETKFYNVLSEMNSMSLDISIEVRRSQYPVIISQLYALMIGLIYTPTIYSLVQDQNQNQVPKQLTFFWHLYHALKSEHLMKTNILINSEFTHTPKIPLLCKLVLIIMLACEYNKTEIAEFCLEKIDSKYVPLYEGLELNLVNHFMYKCLEVAIKHNNLLLVTRLLQKTKTLIKTRTGTSYIIAGKTFKSEVFSDYKYSIMHNAFMYGRLEIVLLLQRQAKLNILSSYLVTAYDADHFDLIDLFLDKDCEYTCRELIDHAMVNGRVDHALGFYKKVYGWKILPNSPRPPHVSFEFFTKATVEKIHNLSPRRHVFQSVFSVIFLTGTTLINTLKSHETFILNDLIMSKRYFCSAHVHPTCCNRMEENATKYDYRCDCWFNINLSNGWLDTSLLAKIYITCKTLLSWQLLRNKVFYWSRIQKIINHLSSMKTKDNSTLNILQNIIMRQLEVDIACILVKYPPPLPIPSYTATVKDWIENVLPYYYF